jgi:hypothetical protein
MTGSLTTCIARALRLEYRAVAIGQLQISKAIRLLAMFAALLMLASPSLGMASAKWTWITRCCCPDPAQCHCPGQRHAQSHSDDEHDEDGSEDSDNDHHDSSSIGPCSNTGNLSSVSTQVASLTSFLTFVKLTMPTQPWISQASLPPATRWLTIETPPF